jgi:hypothetical protein
MLSVRKVVVDAAVTSTALSTLTTMLQAIRLHLGHVLLGYQGAHRVSYLSQRNAKYPQLNSYTVKRLYSTVLVLSFFYVLDILFVVDAFLKCHDVPH